ncbi:MAG TPA: hypothetical protein VHU83_11650 [Bryobacteraceae bacterium]|nr:hypothetical protein [Bryobacteraceae bacterium]
MQVGAKFSDHGNALLREYTGRELAEMSSTRRQLLDFAFLTIKEKIDVGRRYARELNRIREIEQRLGVSGVADKVEAKAVLYKE